MQERSLHPLQHLPCLPQQRPYLPPLFDRLPGKQAVLARVPVCPWRARSLCAAVHAATPIAAHRRRAARAAARGLNAATRARQLCPGLSDMTAQALAFCLASAASCVRLPRAAFGARAADAGGAGGSAVEAKTTRLLVLAQSEVATPNIVARRLRHGGPGSRAISGTLMFDRRPRQSKRTRALSSMLRDQVNSGTPAVASSIPVQVDSAASLIAVGALDPLRRLSGGKVEI